MILETIVTTVASDDDRRDNQFPGQPAPTRKLVDRAPLGVLIVAAIIVIGLLAGVGYLAMVVSRLIATTVA